LIKGKGEDSQEIFNDPFLDLMNSPSTSSDSFLFREQLAMDLMLSGNCYICLIGITDKPTSLIRLHPDEVEIQTDRTGITGYIHTSGGESVIYAPETVIHGRNASYAKGPGSLYGVGIVEPLQMEITADINAMRLASNASQKGRPDILLSPKDETDIWGHERRREILDSYNGLSAQGGAMVLSGQIDVKELKLSPREAEYENARIMARQSISAVSQVPGAVLGLPSANYATATAQLKSYWDVQMQRGTRFAHLFTIIARRFDEQYRVEFDYSGVEALQAKRDSQLARISLHISHGIPPADAYAYEGLSSAPISNDAISDMPNEEIIIEDEIEEAFDLSEYKKKVLIKGR
jgi:HK97 family phage portal protein